jgi:beta-mannosidase
MQQLALTENWHLKQRDESRDLGDDFASTDGWLPATVPGSVHETLLAAGHISDPFYGLNELDVQWVGERDWLYRCEFDVPADLIDAGSVALCCDGLDTFATVWLNGEQVIVSDNMFVPLRVPIDHVLQPGRNIIHILFESALRRGKALEAEHGARRVWNGDASRVYVRKAQYHYGWDWGPCLLAAGPWQPIRIEGGPRIAELHCPVTITDDLSRTTFPVQIMIDGAAEVSNLYVRLQLFDPDGVLLDETIQPHTNPVAHTFTRDQPQLWWPNGYGAQGRYRLIATLLRDDATLDQQEQRLGVRRLRLVQEPLADEPGSTFLFEINNTPLFGGGANWIPADSFTTRLTPDDYRVQIQQVADANMVMLRIWGGGIYEAGVFYDLCDELGLLVWQDFMFACGIYPAHEAFQQSVRAEAEAQVRRLRHHPCIALWCGNNEDYQIAQSLNVYDAAFEGEFTRTGFPARELYERLLPDVCAAIDGTRPYWPGSAYGGANTQDPTIGDRHTWDVWHGTMAPYGDYPKYEGRFVSEFGMASAPSLALLEAVTPPAERYAQSRTMEHHNKADGGRAAWPRTSTTHCGSATH